MTTVPTTPPPAAVDALHACISSMIAVRQAAGMTDPDAIAADVKASLLRMIEADQ